MFVLGDGAVREGKVRVETPDVRALPAVPVPKRAGAPLRS